MMVQMGAASLVNGRSVELLLPQRALVVRSERRGRRFSRERCSASAFSVEKGGSGLEQSGWPGESCGFYTRPAAQLAIRHTHKQRPVAFRRLPPHGLCPVVAVADLWPG